MHASKWSPPKLLEIRGRINIPYSATVHSDIQEECGTSRLVTALVLKFSGAQWDVIAVLTSYLILNT